MDIPVSSDALDVAFHPSSSSNLLATGLISGKVQLIKFAPTNTNGEEEDASTAKSNSAKGKEKQYTKEYTVRPSAKSCRGLAFSSNGDSLLTLSKDGSIHRLDSATGSVVSTWSGAHEAAPSRILPIEPNVFATGDDDGVVSLWDPRRPTSSNAAVRSYTHHFDWITSMLWCTHLAPPKKIKLSKEEEEKKKKKEEKKRKRKERHARTEGTLDDDDGEDAENATTQRERLVVTSGDGTLSVIDIRAGKSGVEVSEDQEDELLSIASVKRDSKLVVGTQLGILSLWAPTKGLLDHVDRIPGHPNSVDAMCTLDDDTILTGSSDGLVRVVQILPHKLLGIVADHGGMPVERMARRDHWLASIGHGREIKLTDLAPLLEDDDGDEEEGEGEDVELEAYDEDDPSKAVDDEESSDDDEDLKSKKAAEDSDESDDDSDGRESTARQAKKPRGATILRPIAQTSDDQSTANFFADL